MGTLNRVTKDNIFSDGINKITEENRQRQIIVVEVHLPRLGLSYPAI